MFTTASVACLMRGRNCMNAFGSGDGRPSFGSRACRCRIAAPACAASMAWVAIWSGVIGNGSDMVGVWIEPVIAQLMMILFAIVVPLCRSLGRRSVELPYTAAFLRAAVLFNRNRRQI